MKVDKRAIITAIPIIMVNLFAFYGQFSYIRTHTPWPLIPDIFFAMALESIALFLTYMAHEALIAEDTAFGLRLMSYGFGVLIGLMNYSHYAPDFRPTFVACATGLCSIASPIMWGIYSRRVSRDELKVKELIEPRSVKLGKARWILWTRESFGVFRLAVWSGQNKPARAIADWEDKQNTPDPIPDPIPDMTVVTAISQGDAIRIAFTELGIEAKTADIIQWLADNPERKWTVSGTRVRQIRGELQRKEIENKRTDLRAITGGYQ